MEALFKGALTVASDIASLLFQRATIWIDLNGFLQGDGRAIVQVSPLLVIHVLRSVAFLLIERPHTQVHANILVLWTVASVQ